MTARCYAQLMYVDAERAFSEWCQSLVMNASNPRKWWSAVKAVLFDASSSLPVLVVSRRKLVWSADEKASLFSAHSDAKQ